MFSFPLTSLIREKSGNGLVHLFVFALIISAALTTDSFAASSRGGASKYTISLSAEESVVNATATPLVTAAVTINGVAAPDKNVVFTWKVKGDSQPPQSGATSATNAKGEAKYRLKNSGGRARTITVTAALEKFPSITATTDIRFELPDGFIALADQPMTQIAAQAFCREQGGKLPRINDSDSLPQADGDKITRIDGFGALGAPWPSGLPYDRYWTDTELAGAPAAPGRHGVWLIGVHNDEVTVHDDGKSVTSRVVCVP